MVWIAVDHHQRGVGRGLDAWPMMSRRLMAAASSILASVRPSLPGAHAAPAPPPPRPRCRAPACRSGRGTQPRSATVCVDLPMPGSPAEQDRGARRPGRRQAHGPARRSRWGRGAVGAAVPARSDEGNLPRCGRLHALGGDPGGRGSTESSDDGVPGATTFAAPGPFAGHGAAALADEAGGGLGDRGSPAAGGGDRRLPRTAGRCARGGGGRTGGGRGVVGGGRPAAWWSDAAATCAAPSGSAPRGGRG